MNSNRGTRILGTGTSHREHKRQKKRGGRKARLLTLDNNAYITLTRGLCHFRKHLKVLAAHRQQKAFTCWRFFVEASRIIHVNDPVEDSEITDLRKSFLTSFSDHENLSKTLEKEKYVLDDKMRRLRHERAGATLLIFMKCKYLNFQGRYFNYWKNHIKNPYFGQIVAERKRLEDGFMIIKAREEEIRFIMETNSRLQLSLLVVIACLRMKSHVVLRRLSNLIKENKVNRQIVWEHIIATKKTVESVSVLKEELIQTAKENGEKFYPSLDHISDKVNKAYKAHAYLAQRLQDNCEQYSAKLEQKAEIDRKTRSNVKNTRSRPNKRSKDKDTFSSTPTTNRSTSNSSSTNTRLSILNHSMLNDTEVGVMMGDGVMNLNMDTQLTPGRISIIQAGNRRKSNLTDYDKNTTHSTPDRRVSQLDNSRRVSQIDNSRRVSQIDNSRRVSQIDNSRRVSQIGEGSKSLAISPATRKRSQLKVTYDDNGRRRVSHVPTTAADILNGGDNSKRLSSIRTSVDLSSFS